MSSCYRASKLPKENEKIVVDERLKFPNADRDLVSRLFGREVIVDNRKEIVSSGASKPQ